MLDISNKLHALVDEFVSNLSLECDSLANNISAHMYVAHDSALEVVKTLRPSNRTTSEVLNGLKKPSGTHLTNSHHREDKSHVQHAKSNLKARNNRSKDEGRSLRYVKATKSKSGALQGVDD